MSLFNLHTHTRFSDGSEQPEAYIREAVAQGFTTLGFTDHSPVPFENNFAIREGGLEAYCSAISALRNENPGIDSQNQIEILLGLEVDFIPGVTTSFAELKSRYGFDYLIGSVHLVRNGSPGELWFIDGPDISIYDRGLREIFGRDAKKAVTAFYRQTAEMIEKQRPDIIGHLDKVKMYNRGRYFTESDPWYINLVDEILALARTAGSVIEVNTRGVYKKRSETLFPGPEVLRKILNMGIPVTLSSDAHKPHELSLGFAEARQVLKETGFRCIMNRAARGWIEIPL
jgi:histidinol-phosphatase (PHP family)